MKSNYFKLGISLFLVTSLVFPFQSESARKKRVYVRSSYSQAINKNKAALSSTKSVLQQKKKIVEKLKKEESQITRVLDTLEKRIENNSIKLADAQFRYEQTQKQIKVTDNKLKETETRLQRQVRITQNTVKRLYKYRYIDYLIFLLNSENISTFMRRSVYFNYIIKQDNEQINEIKHTKEEIKDLKKEFQEKKVKIAKFSKMVAVQKSKYEESQQDHEEYLHQVQTKKETYEREVQALEQESNRISSMLIALSNRQKQELAMAKSGRKYASVGSYSYKYTGGKLGWPCASTNLTSYFGYRVHPIFGTRKLHSGMDVGAGAGTPIYAAGNGLVVESGWTGGYGKAVIIDHGGGIATLYAHSSELYVYPGQKVKRGQLIAAIGSTGFSTGPHLHFEVRVNGVPVDPLAYLR
jgi:murein DD-endopeptidase MepM/ murein hydrolase activator NlpD